MATDDKRQEVNNGSGSTRRVLQRGRSSPSHSLDDAVDGAQRIFNALGTSSHSRDDAAQAMGYTPGSGAANSKVGSLTHFRLLERSSAEYKVSDLARRILEPHGETEKMQALAEAAASPSLYAELIEQYDGQPCPPMLSNILSRTYGVAPKAAPGVASRFEATLNYAGLLRNGKIYATLPRSAEDAAEDPQSSDPVVSGEEPASDARRSAPRDAVAAGRGYRIPLRKKREAILDIPRPVGQADLDRIKQWIDLMSDVLTEDPDGEGEGGVL